MICCQPTNVCESLGLLIHGLTPSVAPLRDYSHGASNELALPPQNTAILRCHPLKPPGGRSVVSNGTFVSRSGTNIDWHKTTDDNKQSQRELWRKIDDVLGRGQTPRNRDITAELFNKFFVNKIEKGRQSTDNIPLPTFTKTSHTSVENVRTCHSRRSSIFYNKTSRQVLCNRPHSVSILKQL